MYNVDNYKILICYIYLNLIFSKVFLFKLLNIGSSNQKNSLHKNMPKFEQINQKTFQMDVVQSLNYFGIFFVCFLCLDR